MDHRLQIILAAKDLTGTALTKFKGTIGAIAKSIFSLRGAIGILGGTGGIGYLVKSSLDAADALGKAADVAGIHTAALQEYQHAASLSGVSTELLNSSFLAFNKRLGEARANTGPLITYLKKVDEQFLNQIQSARSTEDALKLVFNRMGSLTNAADRAALANAAFSRSGVKLVNMTKNGAAGLDSMRAEARRLGLVISDELIRGAETANDQLGTLGTVLKTQVTATIVELAPKITEISGDILKWVENNQQLIQQDIPKYIGEIATSVGSLAAELVKITDMWQGNQAFFKALFMPEGFGSGEGLRRHLGGGPKIWHGKISGQPGEVGGQPPPSGRAAGISVESPAGRWSPRSDRGPWAPRAGGLVGTVEAEKQLLAEMTEATETAYDKMDAHVQAYYDNIEAQAQKTAEGVGYLADTMSNAFTGFVTDGKFSFSDFADSIIADLIRIQTRTLLTNLFSSAAASGAGSGFFSFFSANAKGAAYGPGGRARFAAGGIVNRPTVFPFAGGMGLMGEAGPEGILPLARTRGGDLGVKTTAGGDGNDVQVIVNNNSGSPATVSRSNDPDGLRRIIIDIAKNDVLRGGQLARAHEQVYHLSRKGRIA